MSSDRKLFMINDPIHGHIELHPLLVKIIDTPEFQRLRYIKQLGGTYYVYPGGCHNRFEHSIGVSYLAGKMVETLREKQRKLGITDKEVLCVKVAGLCHDLGHGPFSHLFDQLFIPEVCPDAMEDGKRWKHEQASVEMFHHMLDKNQRVRDEFKCWKLNIKKHGEFIAELITGKPGDSSPQKWRIEKRFLYEIVANNTNGIDVDKWDYFARDSHSLGIPSNFDMGRTMHLVRAVKCRGKEVDHYTCPEGTTHLCMRDNEVYNLYEMFHTRYSLHKRAYQHKVVKGVELMITDALVAANDHLTFRGKRMSEAIGDMDAYIQLTDEVFQQILHSTDDKMETARGILQQLQTRDLYKCIIDEPCDDWKRELPTGHIIHKEIAKEIAKEAPEMKLSSDEIHVLVARLSYGMEAKNPMLFYKKEDQDKAVLIRREKVSLLLPETSLECRIRVYVKKPENENIARDCFEKWWDKQPKDKDLKIKKLTEENMRLKEKVETLEKEQLDREMRSNSVDRRRGHRKRRAKRSRPY